MPELLDFQPLFPDEDEATIRARWDAWANEGTSPDDDRWTDTREGSMHFVVTQGGVREAAKTYDHMNEVAACAFPLWSWGEYLDDHAEVQDILRLPATPGAGTVTFTADEGTVIGAGTRVGVTPADPDAEAAEFEVTLGGTVPAPVLPATQGELTLPVIAVEDGAAGNVGVGAITDVLSPPMPGVSVVNDDPTVGGTDVEDDERLLDRLLDEYLGKPTGNVNWYRSVARNYPGVGRVTVIPLWNGPGTVRVIIMDPDGQPNAPETVTGLQSLLDPTVQRGDGRAPVGAAVNVTTGTLLSIDVSGTVEFDTGYSLDGAGGTVALGDAIRLAIERYVEAVEPGGEVVLSQVAGRLATVRGVHDVADVELNGAAANVPVDDDPPQVPMLDDTSGLVEGAAP